jgi:hypothetical protein
MEIQEVFQCSVMQTRPLFPVTMNGRLYDAATLAKIFQENPRDPFTRKPVHIGDIKDLTRLERESFDLAWPDKPPVLQLQHARGIVADFYFKEGYFEGAAELRHPKGMAAYAIQLFNQGKRTEAKVWAERADFNWVMDGAYLLGIIHAVEGDLSKALHYSHKCLADTYFNKRTEVTTRVALLYLRKNNLKKAKQFAWKVRYTTYGTVVSAQIAFLEKNYSKVDRVLSGEYNRTPCGFFLYALTLLQWKDKQGHTLLCEMGDFPPALKFFQGVPVDELVVNLDCFIEWKAPST